MATKQKVGRGPCMKLVHIYVVPPCVAELVSIFASNYEETNVKMIKN